MRDAREKLEQVVENALQAYGDYDPNAEDSIVSRIVDALCADDRQGRWGWLIAYGKVHEVTETDHVDSDGETVTYTAFTRYVSDEEDEE